MNKIKVADMGIKKVIKYYLLGESLKEIEANRILDKLSKNKQISDKEKRFLDLYRHTSNNEEPKDLMYLSKNVTCEYVKSLLQKGYIVFCDLHDRDGLIGLPIIDIDNEHQDEDCIIYMKGDEKHKLYDRYLYNLIYNSKLKRYSLQEQDEYFEEIEHKND